MAINKVDNTTQEQNYTFLPNQSSILRTVNTNKITVNGVNVIVDKPKRGDIMCVTNQKVIWIDGLSIDPQQLPSEYTPVGICLLIKGNKALVCYKDKINVSWAQGNRWDLEAMNDLDSDFFKDTANKSVTIHCECKLSNGAYSSIDVNFGPWPYESYEEEYNYIRESFVSKLNDALRENTNGQYFAQLLYADGDKETSYIEDTIVNRKFKNRIVITGAFAGYFHNDLKIWYTTSNGTVKAIIGKDKDATKSAKMFMCKSILYINGFGDRVDKYYYSNNQNNFLTLESGCCRSKFYDWIQTFQTAPNAVMTSIDTVPGGKWDGKIPVRKTDFDNNSNCKILRDTFASYDEYLDSMMIKVPDRKNHLQFTNVVSCFPSGKENTYKLAGCTYLKSTGTNEPLFTWADWAAGINVNSPGLTAGNWWVPSVAELSEIMRDITYGTNSWSLNPDIINRVISKMRLEGTPNASNNSEVWPHLGASAHWWTSFTYDNEKLAYCYDNVRGIMGNSNIYTMRNFMAITLYDYTK